MENINLITEQMINDMNNEKKNDLKNCSLNKECLILIECIKKIKNPFRMIGVKDVMRDLNICETIAYKTFKRDDFPSINIGKTNQVMLIAYLIWKMNKRN